MIRKSGMRKTCVRVYFYIKRKVFLSDAYHGFGNIYFNWNILFIYVQEEGKNVKKKLHEDIPSE